MGFGFASSIYDRRNSSGSRILPGWAATEVRRVEFWTDVAERRKRMAARETPRGWWSASPNQCLRARLDDAFWTLRDGGWREDEVRDMLNGHDSSQALSPAGWYREDVAYTIGRKSRDCDASRNRSDSVVDRNLCTETRQFLSTSCCVDEEVHQKKCGEITTLMYLLSLEA
ncbi:PREDICTED: uncharacterized protein LOC104804192 [Tarenaya hassleriana]|uniref:uncharacterized protein LOC104804192 n=1 Tax=Tarenaya hassleriana TaxID=28532 RepID=UPI00053C70CF|nr:PREDICTED: uncharacterized protein LOC104804192 [Tarenaya hassleriana]